MRFEDVEYVGHDDLLDNSSQVSPSVRGNGANYAEWLKLKCANSAVGWILVEEIEDAPGFHKPNIIKYGVARDKP